MLRRVAVAVAITAAFSGTMYTTDGCAPAKQVEPIPVVMVDVTDERTGRPVVDATVRIEQGRINGSTHTPTGGRAVFGYLDAWRHLSPGTARISVEAAGYRSTSISVELADGDNVFQIKLQPFP